MKRFKFLISILTIPILLLTYAGCIGLPECGADSEPEMRISVSGNRIYTRVYGLKKTIQPIPPQNTNTWIVPVSIIDDTTTVIFEAESHTDTLTIAYTRDVEAESLRCGVRLFLKNIRVTAPTTFERVDIYSISNSVISISTSDE